MDQYSEDVSREKVFKFDRTISLPTIITVLTMIGGWWWWSTQIYTDLRLTDREHAQEIKALKADLARIENAQSTLARDVKDDLRDINAKLDRLNDRLAGSVVAKDWSK